MRRGVATFTLDEGRCPPWLFERMVALSREMVRAIVAEEGPDALVRRLADPVWFQSFGTVLAFDWNASGLTTTLTGALKEAIRGEEERLGIFICGGKGRTSRKTPEQIETWGARLGTRVEDIRAFTYTSRMAAKVDSALIQDGFQIYHHTFFFTPPDTHGRGGAWTVVQQGMDKERGMARRYHWHSANVQDLIVEPHTGIASMGQSQNVLDLSATESGSAREGSLSWITGGSRTFLADLERLERYESDLVRTARVTQHMSGSTPPASAPPPKGQSEDQLTLLSLSDREFHTHPVQRERFFDSPYLKKILQKVHSDKPPSYEALLATEGVGPKTVRALALVAEVLYGAPPSFTDPARYSFAHGGKDATPYPVDRTTYDESIRHVRDYARNVLPKDITPPHVNTHTNGEHERLDANEERAE